MANIPIEVQKILDQETIKDGQVFIGTYGSDPVASPGIVLTSSTLTGTSVQLQTPLDLDGNGYALRPSDGTTVQLYSELGYTIVIRDRFGGIAYGPVDVLNASTNVNSVGSGQSLLKTTGNVDVEAYSIGVSGGLGISVVDDEIIIDGNPPGIGPVYVVDQVVGTATVAANTDLQRTGLLTPFGSQYRLGDFKQGNYAIADGYLWVIDFKFGEWAKLQKFEETYPNTWEYTGISLDISSQIGANRANSVCADSGDNVWVVADSGIMYKYSPAVSPNGDTLVYASVSLNIAAQGVFAYRGIALDASGNFWIYQGIGSKTIYKYNPSGATFVYSGTSFVLEQYNDNSGSDITIDSNDDLWVIEQIPLSFNMRIRKYTPNAGSWTDSGMTISAEPSYGFGGHLTTDGTKVMLFRNGSPYQYNIEYFDIPSKTVSLTDIGKMLGAGDTATNGSVDLDDCISIDDDTIGCTTTMTTGTHTITRNMLKGDKVEYYDATTSVWRTPIKY